MSVGEPWDLWGSPGCLWGALGFMGEPWVFNMNKAWFRLLVRMEPTWGRKGQAERQCDTETALLGWS